MMILGGLYGLLYGIWGLILSLVNCEKTTSEIILKNHLKHIFLSSIFVYLCLAYAIYFRDFSLKYAYEQSAINLNFPISLGLLWSGQVGANWLFWTILSLSSWITFRYIPLERPLNLKEKGVLVFYLVGFLSLILLTSSPFEMLLPFEPTQGLELNPLLQHYVISFHPPLLIGSTASIFSLVLIELCPFSQRAKKDFFDILIRLILGGLGFAILAGAFWAYHVLGWGGWWFWDPIETISFIHWIGLLWIFHTDKRDLKASLFIWAIIAFNLWIVRSDQLVSVHSFISQGWHSLWLLYASGCFFIAITLSSLSSFYFFPALSSTLIFCILGLWSPFFYQFFHISLQMSASYYEQILLVVFTSLFILRLKIPYPSEHAVMWLVLCALDHVMFYQMLFISYLCLIQIFYTQKKSMKDLQHSLVFIFLILCFAQRLFSFQTQWPISETYSYGNLEITLVKQLTTQNNSHTHRIYTFSLNKNDRIDVEEIYYPSFDQTITPIHYWKDRYGNDYGFCYSPHDQSLRFFYRPFMLWIWICGLSICLGFFTNGLFLIYKKAISSQTRGNHEKNFVFEYLH